MKPIWLVLALAACGALDQPAPKPPAKLRCPTVAERLQPLVDLADHGQLRHMADLIEHQVDEPSQRALVRVVLAIGAALPPNSIDQLPVLLADPRGAQLIPLVVAILVTLPGDPAAQPPLPPQIEEMSAFSRVTGKCLSRQLFAVLTDVLREPDLPQAIDTLLGAASTAGPQLRTALQATGVAGRQAFQALSRDLFTSIAAPGFDPLALAATLRHLDDPAKPGAPTALALLVERLGRTHTLQPTPDRVAALQDLAQCVRLQDPDDRLAGHLYDVLIAPPSAPTPTSLPDAATPTHTGELLTLAAYVTDVLAHDDGARDALSQLLGLILRPDLAIQAIPELIGLLQSDALPGVIEVLVDLSGKGCTPTVLP